MLFKKYGIVCHRLKAFVFIESLTLVTIEALTVNYTIVSKVYEHKSVGLQLILFSLCGFIKF